MKILILCLIALLAGWHLYIGYRDYKSTDNPIPFNVLTVYDRTTYKKWQRYHKEHVGLSMIEKTVSSLLLYVLIRLNVFAGIAPGSGVYGPMIAVILFDSILETVVDVIFSYLSMGIEEKYGFNKTTMDTFFMDQLKSFVIGVVLNIALMSIFVAIHRAMGDWILVLFAGLILLVVLLISFLFPYLSGIFNKFTPLEDGELRQKLTELLEKHGYRVRDITVMDASRRTSKSNAYFTGFGKTKTIVLYDNLLKALTTEEICAVFAHEMGHGLHRDTLKNQIYSLGSIAMLAILMWLHARNPASCTPFGFEGLNYGFIYILTGVYMSIFEIGYGILTSRAQRKAEFRADAQAVDEGYGDALVSGLKKLAREDFAQLSPDPLIVRLMYSHPTLSQRIAAIEKRKAEKP